MKNNNLLELKKKFIEIKNMGWVTATRSGNTAIGKTFEDLLGKMEDNLAEPDFGDIEIKSQRELSKSFVTLFTKAPSYPKSANTYLREKYGDKNEENLRTLHTSIFRDENTYKERYSFSLEIDENEERIYIKVKDLNTKNTEQLVYYSFETIKNKLDKKLKKLAYVEAKTKYLNNGKEAFYYTKMTMYENPSLENFLNLIKENKIMIDIRIGVYHDLKKYGKTHDHGTGFRIKEENFCELYKCKYDIEEI